MADVCLTKVSKWRDVAIELYFRSFGKRCVRCSKPVKKTEAAIYQMSTGELLLVHKRCKA